MTETIKGGAYLNPDGTWVNAQGKPIKPPTKPKAPSEPKQDLKPLSLAELRALAKERGLENSESLKKAELLELLAAAPKAES